MRVFATENKTAVVVVASYRSVSRNPVLFKALTGSLHSKTAQLIEYIDERKLRGSFSNKLMHNAHLLEEKSILSANMLKTGHPDKTDFFLLVYTFLSRSFK